MENKQVEYSDFLPLWKEFLKDAQSVLNVQMVAHHFYNLGRDTAPRELSNEEIIELTKDSSIFEYREFNDDMVRFAIAILKKASEK